MRTNNIYKLRLLPFAILLIITLTSSCNNDDDIIYEDSITSTSNNLPDISDYPIVDTDQFTFYDNIAAISIPSKGDDFYGQDATYRGNQASYTDNEDGTITDNVTGLMW